MVALMECNYCAVGFSIHKVSVWWVCVWNVFCGQMKWLGVWRAGSMVRTLPSNSSVITENWTISASEPRSFWEGNR